MSGRLPKHGESNPATGARSHGHYSEVLTVYVVTLWPRTRREERNQRPPFGVHRWQLRKRDDAFSAGELPIRIAAAPTTWHGTLEMARAEIPHGLTRIERAESDGERIVETWT